MVKLIGAFKNFCSTWKRADREGKPVGFWDSLTDEEQEYLAGNGPA